jgi:hypothetical protein
MSEPVSQPALLLGARVPKRFVERLSARFDVLGPLTVPFAASAAARWRRRRRCGTW